MNLGDMGTVVKTDLLVIGGGFGGLWTAIKASQGGVRDICIIDKTCVAFGGQSKMSAGATIYMYDGADPAEWLKAVFLGQQGMCRQDMVESLLTESGERLRELESWGIEYRRTPETGDYIRMPARGLAPAMMTVFPTYEGVCGGSALTTVLRKEALRRGVRFQNKVFINDLIVRDNRAQGAIGIDRRTGECFIYAAGAVVMAASDCSFRGDYACVEQSTGDGFAIAYNAGADLADMEFMCTNTGPLTFNFEGTGPAGQAGAEYLNSKGEHFMPSYNPKGSKAELNYIVRAMAAEYRKGNGTPLYFDFRKLPPDMEKLYLSMGGWMPRNLMRLREKGVQMFKSRNEWGPVVQTLRGGVKTDRTCMSNIAGLFSSGTNHSMGPGLFNGWSSAKCFWSGATAGTSAAHYLASSNGSKIDTAAVGSLKQRLFDRPVATDQGDLTINQVTEAIQRTLFYFKTSIHKSEASLQQATGAIASIKEEQLPRAKIPDLHEFIKFRETQNMLLVAELFLKASILRKESRFDHWREDYPAMDPGWLKWIVFNKDLPEGHRLEDLPWAQYRFQPEHLDSARG